MCVLSIQNYETVLPSCLAIVDVMFLVSHPRYGTKPATRPGGGIGRYNQPAVCRGQRYPVYAHDQYAGFAEGQGHYARCSCCLTHLHQRRSTVRSVAAYVESARKLSAYWLQLHVSPLLIDLPKKKSRNSLFAQQNKLKLVTHCQLDEWVVREYLVYKLYNLLTDLSFRARLARVTYTDSLGKRSPETHWGFLLEDESDVAKRNNVKVSNTKQTAMTRADSLRMATVSVFEFMIGNTDWSVPYLHNIRLFSNGRPALLPVPYDFDHAGIVEANYALPAEQLSIQSVRERLYRGPSYPPALLQQVFDSFNRLKPQFYALYQNESRLDNRYVKRTLKYLDEFYALINKPTSVQQVFSPNINSRIVIKGLK